MICTDTRLGALLVAYELRELPEAEDASFEHHLLECPYCFENLEAVALARELRATRLAEHSPTRTPPRSLRHRAPMVALAAVALLVSFLAGTLASRPVTGGPPKSARGELDRARLDLRGGRLEPAGAAAHRALAIEPGNAEAHYLLAEVCRGRGDLVAAYDHLSLAAQRLTGLADSAAAEILDLRGDIEEALGRHESAAASYRDAARAASREHLPSYAAQILSKQAALLFGRLFRAEEGRAALEEARVAAATSGDPLAAIAVGEVDLTWRLFVEGDLDSARAIAERSAALAERAGAAARCRARIHRGLVHEYSVVAGREPAENLAAAAEEFRRALEECELMQDEPGRAAALMHLGRVKLREGQPEAASQYLERAIEIAARHGLGFRLVLAQANLGLAKLLLGHPASALPILEEARELAERHALSLAEAEVLRIQGRALLAAGHTREARAALIAAQERMELAYPTFVRQIETEEIQQVLRSASDSPGESPASTAPGVIPAQPAFTY